MSTLTELLTKNHDRRLREKENLVLRSASQASTGSGETFWCAFSFLLFLVLGPFAAVPALFSVFSLAPGHEEGMEPEMMSK